MSVDEGATGGEKQEARDERRRNAKPGKREGKKKEERQRMIAWSPAFVSHFMHRNTGPAVISLSPLVLACPLLSSLPVPSRPFLPSGRTRDDRKASQGSHLLAGSSAPERQGSKVTRGKARERVSEVARGQKKNQMKNK